MSLSGLGTKKPKLGIIGGSGLCSFPELNLVSKIKIETKYGLPSDVISVCRYKDQLVAFLPRHGSKHTLAPHKVPYKANISAFKQIGVEYVIGTCIVGSLKKEIAPGSIVIPDQFVNLTWGRDDFSEDNGSFVHLPMGEPYCSHLREMIIARAGDGVISQATVAVIQGPRFSTIAESRWFSANGWDIINMTQYPECYFAKELGLCYVAVASVTDYDVGLQEDLMIDSVNMDTILKVFRANIQKTKSLLLAFVEKSAQKLSCKCAANVVDAYYKDLL